MELFFVVNKIKISLVYLSYFILSLSPADSYNDRRLR